MRVPPWWLATVGLVIACPRSEPFGRAEPEAEPAVRARPVSPPSAAAAVAGNLLGDEPSPYLQHHADDPVHWRAWNEATLEHARRSGKPIFLSIGYATCHWCHVMEEESFEDEEVAAFLNEHFVAIKVDREERPDIDAIYIDAVAALGGSTGWPLNVFLTPAREPFYGGTYFPRHAEQGRPGFLEVLARVEAQYREHGDRVAAEGRRVLEVVEQRALGAVAEAQPLRPRMSSEAIAATMAARDLEHGGFGRRQKFPQSPLLLALLRQVQRVGDPSARTHLVRTLEAMARGGIRDHLHGSFHRYTVDDRWHLPHFEKTLYDNAQLAAIYIEAGRELRRPDLVAVGTAVLDDLLARWQAPHGGFVVGFDADDPGGEGYYYSWTPAELAAVLPPRDAEVIARAFGVTERGDPQIEGRNVLHRQDDETVAAALGLEAAELRAIVERSLPRLEEARSARRPPATDDKALVAWNGLAIMALADAARWLDEPRYREAAVRAATWIRDVPWVDGRMRRGVVGSRLLSADAMLDDHAAAGLAMLRLHAATGDPGWLEQARRHGDAILEGFHDPTRHLLLQTRHDAVEGELRLPVRLVDFGDDALPSGGALAVRLLLELGAITGDEALYDAGWQVLERAAEPAVARPLESGAMLVALDHATGSVHEVVIAGDPDDATTAALAKVLASTGHRRVLPVLVPAAGITAALLPRFPALEGKHARRGQATAYVCQRGRCQAPTSDPAVLAEQLARIAAEDQARARQEHRERPTP